MDLPHDPLDCALRDLEERLVNVAAAIKIIVALRRESGALLDPLRVGLTRLKATIDQVLPIIDGEDAP
jgi:hypothetical protein